MHVDIAGGQSLILEARPKDPLARDGAEILLGWRPEDIIVLTR